MTPRSLLVAALFGLSMLQPLANLAEAAASPAAGASAKPAAKKPIAKTVAQKKKAALKSSTRKTVRKARAGSATSKARRLSLSLAPAAAGASAALVAPAAATEDVALTLDAGGMPVPEAAGLEAVLAGLREVHADDDTLTQAAAQMFDALYALPPSSPTSPSTVPSAAP